MVLREIGALKPGMVLGKAACTSQGALLIKERTPLNERNILVLKTWGVAEVWVEGEEKPVSLPEPGPPETLKGETEEELKEKFSGVLDHQAMEEVMRVARKLLSRGSEEA
jgi:hypothetical protein